MKTVSVNGRDYHWPRAPLVVICCDGSEPDYMEVAMTAGLMPNLKRIIAKGENLRGHSAIPSFTNPNNLSIVTGRPPAVHGICGNYLIDPATGQETMMNDPKWLRAPTIFAGLPEGGRQGGGGDGQGQAAPAARQGPRLRRHGGGVLLGEGRQGDTARTTASRTLAHWSAWPCRMSTRPNSRSSSSRPA